MLSKRECIKFSAEQYRILYEKHYCKQSDIFDKMAKCWSTTNGQSCTLYNNVTNMIKDTSAVSDLPPCYIFKNGTCIDLLLETESNNC